MPFRLPGLSDLFSQYGVSVSMKTEPSSMDPPGLARSPCPHLLGEVLQALGVAPAPFVAGHLLGQLRDVPHMDILSPSPRSIA